ASACAEVIRAVRRENLLSGPMAIDVVLSISNFKLCTQGAYHCRLRLAHLPLIWHKAVKFQ
ncbi:MAG: hypothetical protein ACKVK8_07700, partial [Rhodospirillales bacterium]